MTIQQSWIRCFQPNSQTRLRLFCFPYAGGGASAFRTWPNQLPSSVEINAIQPPGREDRFKETPCSDLSSLIAALLPTLMPYLDRPFAFFGHSVGALVCFELARHLRRQAAPSPVHLFISGRRAPHIPDPDQPIHQAPDAHLLEDLRYYGGTPEAVLRSPELMALFLPTLRADLAINETYQYTDEPPLDFSMSVFGGLEDRKVDRAGLNAWREQTNAIANIQLFSGGHFFLKDASDKLLHTISNELLLLL
jgi:medium-chain acyl-[acyl-carrier-protein] hydrolase